MNLESLTRTLRRAALITTAIVLVTITAGCSAGCSASVSVGHKKTGGAYHAHGVSFKIPDGWGRLTDLTSRSGTGNEIWSEGFAPKSGYDLVGITAYATKLTVTPENAGKHASVVAAAIREFATSAGGSVLKGPIVITMRGMAGYRFEAIYDSESGETLTSRMLLVWNGHTEYFFNCQYRKNGTQGAEIKRGCRTIESTFKLD